MNTVVRLYPEYCTAVGTDQYVNIYTEHNIYNEYQYMSIFHTTKCFVQRYNSSTSTNLSLTVLLDYTETVLYLLYISSCPPVLYKYKIRADSLFCQL